MDNRFLLSGLAAACIAIAITSPSSAEASAATWIANGSSACEKFLTRDVLAEILIKPEGAPEKIDANSCHIGPIYISLAVKKVNAFKLSLPQIVGVNMMAGVGDLAYWNHAGAIAAVKNPDRECDASVIGGAPKIRDEALGRKLGEICNKLFALP